MSKQTKEDFKYIYLQPKCCVESSAGRMWCEDESPEDREDGVDWTRYVRADLHEEGLEYIERLQKENEELKEVMSFDLIGVPYLKNRGDGVDGHYCITRKRKDGANEYWHDKLKKWCSAGTVVPLGKIDSGAL